MNCELRRVLFVQKYLLEVRLSGLNHGLEQVKEPRDSAADGHCPRCIPCEMGNAACEDFHPDFLGYCELRTQRLFRSCPNEFWGQVHALLIRNCVPSQTSCNVFPGCFSLLFRGLRVLFQAAHEAAIGIKGSVSRWWPWMRRE